VRRRSGWITANGAARPAGAAGLGPAAPIGPRGHTDFWEEDFPGLKGQRPPPPLTLLRANHHRLAGSGNSTGPSRQRDAAYPSVEEKPPQSPAGISVAAGGPRPGPAGLWHLFCWVLGTKKPAPGFVTTRNVRFCLPGSGAVGLRLPFRAFGVQGSTPSSPAPVAGARTRGGQQSRTGEPVPGKRAPGLRPPGSGRADSRQVTRVPGDGTPE
jgi:hypothetical protein